MLISTVHANPWVNNLVTYQRHIRNFFLWPPETNFYPNSDFKKKQQLWFTFLIRKKNLLDLHFSISHLMTSSSSLILPNLSQRNRCLIISFFLPSSIHVLIFDLQTYRTQIFRVCLLRLQDTLACAKVQ